MDYQATLQHALSKYLPVEPALLAWLLPHFRSRHVAKHDLLLASGTTCDFWGFVHRGLVRVYTVAESGEEHTGWFVKEGDFVTEYTSFYYQRPSLENMVALEDTELLVVDYQQLQVLYHESPAFERVSRLLYEKQMADLKQLLTSRVQYGALTRYHHFLAHYPAFAQRVPLKFLASYLGITDSTLSRIRNHAKAKKLRAMD